MMQPRMKHPVALLPAANQALQALGKSAKIDEIPSVVHTLIQLRASQINGCSFCVDLHSRELKQVGESDERIYTVAAWRDSPFFSEAERAALALAEAVTRVDDRADPVPDDVWQGAAAHFSAAGLAALLVSIATINAWNRLNVATRQLARGPRASK
jgi:AhpD family alkylhydroperoxidase